MPHPHLLVQPRPGFTWLRLAHPERRNALDIGLAAALRDALAADVTRPVLLGSSDLSVFCAGADLTIPDAERAAVSDLVYDCCELLITRPGPVIAVVTGPAVGGGAQLAAAADLRVASDGARLRFTGPPGMDLVVGAWLLPSLVGRGLAMDLALTGRWVESAEALAAGLVNRVVADPVAVAEQMAASFRARPAVKEVMAAGDLMDRLRAERRANQDAWAIRIGS
ncbi:MAG TPA: enoyl-CoA hydratase/isomerase family protein [Streptosporangiaceae bacterium]|nr:enoyl-CoA hydratase/isomerase family protein [Streptosporangiaceae bacterium]